MQTAQEQRRQAGLGGRNTPLLQGTCSFRFDQRWPAMLLETTCCYCPRMYQSPADEGTPAPEAQLFHILPLPSGRALLLLQPPKLLISSWDSSLLGDDDPVGILG